MTRHPIPPAQASDEPLYNATAMDRQYLSGYDAGFMAGERGDVALRAQVHANRTAAIREHAATCAAPADMQASDEPMRAAPVDGDAIAKSKRIMGLIDDYTEAMDSPINQHARDARTAIRCALMSEFEAATPQSSGNAGELAPRATADVERDAAQVSVNRRLARYAYLRENSQQYYVAFRDESGAFRQIRGNELDKRIDADLATKGAKP